MVKPSPDKKIPTDPKRRERLVFFYQRFVGGVIDSGCWPWLGAITKEGYGNFGMAGSPGNNIRAHRFAYELAYGPIPDGMLVCHRCDNRRCVNPAHLFLGTAKQNTGDMVAKGRWKGNPSGSGNTQAKLTETDVIEIRKVEGKTSAPELARKYGVTRAAIHLIWKRENWAHVP